MAAAPDKWTPWIWGLKVLLVLSLMTVVSIGLFFGGFRPQATTQEVEICQSNLVALANAARAYAEDNGGVYPGPGWDKALAKYLSTDVVLSCPRQRRVDPKSSGYAMNQQAAGKLMTQVSPDAVLFFDYSGTEHGVVADSRETPFPGRHKTGKSNNVVYAGGLAASVSAR